MISALSKKQLYPDAKQQKKVTRTVVLRIHALWKFRVRALPPRVSDSQFHTSPHAIEHVVSYHISGSLELAFSPSSVTMRRCSKDFNRLVGTSLVFSLAKWHFKNIGYFVDNWVRIKAKIVRKRSKSSADLVYFSSAVPELRLSDTCCWFLGADMVLCLMRWNM